MSRSQWISPSRLEPAGVLAAMVVYAATVLAFADFVPIWDGLLYSRDCVVQAVSEPFSLMSFNCFGHPTMAYVLLLALPQYLDPGNVTLLHGTNMLLGLVSIAAFFVILRRLFPGEDLWLERTLATVVYAGFPLLTANTLNMNPDFGVLVFFLVTLALMLHRRVALTAVAGSFLVFSKEPGVLLFVCIISTHAFFHIFRTELSGKQKLQRLIKLWPLGIPVVLFAAFYAYKAHLAGPVLWAGGDTSRPGNVLYSFTSFSLLDHTFLGYLRGIFLINYNWFLTLFVGALALVRVVQILFGLPRSRPQHCRHGDLGMVLLLFVLVLFLLTRFPTFTNFRYLLPVYPLLIIVFFHSLCVFLRSKTLRIMAIGAAFFMTYFSNFGTLDPLSRQMYGTFDFGARDMLKITSVTGECCGHGRDQLVYNLQFTKFHTALDHFFQTIKPTRDTVVLAHSGHRSVKEPQADFFLVGTIDKKTFGRTLLKENDLGLRTKRLRRLVLRKKKPRVAYYLELPNYDSRYELYLASKFYRVEWAREFGDPDYLIRAFKLILK